MFCSRQHWEGQACIQSAYTIIRSYARCMAHLERTVTFIPFILLISLSVGYKVDLMHKPNESHESVFGLPLSPRVIDLFIGLPYDATYADVSWKFGNRGTKVGSFRIRFTWKLLKFEVCGSQQVHLPDPFSDLCVDSFNE